MCSQNRINTATVSRYDLWYVISTSFDVIDSLPVYTVVLIATDILQLFFVLDLWVYIVQVQCVMDTSVS